MADVKPDLSSEPINLKLRNAAGEELMFKVKRSTKMRKIMDTYATRTEQQVAALKFVVDDKVVKEDDTPQSLGLEDGDQIDVMMMQTGGGA